MSADQLGTTTREDGSSQVTYNGWPLYYFAPDDKPGDAKGQYVGDVWFAVSTLGEAVAILVPTPTMAMDHPTAEPTPAPTSAPTSATVVAEPPVAPAPTVTPLAAVARPSPAPAPVAGGPLASPTPSPTVVTAPAPTTAPAPAPAPTKAPALAPAPPPLPPPASVLPVVQEVAVIEDYAQSRFYPEGIIVIKDVPLELHVTRRNREHVNQFNIMPFLRSTNLILS